MKISVVSFTRAGAEKNLELTGLLQQKRHQAVSYSWHCYTGRKLIPFQSEELLFEDLWEEQELILLLCGMERVVRRLAPLIGWRSEGPAVAVMDEEGRFLVPLLKGKSGGAEEWCRWFSEQCSAACVWTMGKGREERFRAETFAQKNGLCIQDPFRIGTVTECLEAGSPVGIYSDYAIEGVIPEGLIPIGGAGFAGMKVSSSVPETGISVTDDWEAPHFIKECRMFPHNLTAGIYCAEDVSAQELEQALRKGLAENHLSRERLFSLHAVKTHGLEAVRSVGQRLDVPVFFLDEDSLPAGEKPIWERVCLPAKEAVTLRFTYREQERIAFSVYEKKASLYF